MSDSYTGNYTVPYYLFATVFFHIPLVLYTFLLRPSFLLISYFSLFNHLTNSFKVLNLQLYHYSSYHILIQLQLCLFIRLLVGLFISN